MRPESAHSALRILARGASLVSLALIGAFAFGEEFDLSAFSGKELALFACFPTGVVIGLVLGWWNELLGGALTLLALAAFYVLHTLGGGGLPRGLAFVLLTSPGVLFLASYAARRRGGSLSG